MGDTIELTASDGHRLSAYRCEPAGACKGGIVVVQEIFGVNGHIRDLCEGFAAQGYRAVAPALFDRVERGVALDYDQAGIDRGRELAGAIGWDWPTRDIWSAAQSVHAEGKAGVVGYCWGGSWTWIAGCRLDVAAVVCYYGRHIVDHLDEQPRAPVLMHFGLEDASIPMANVKRIYEAFPAIPIYTYEEAGHGFNCDRRKDYREDAARLALRRTLAHFDQYLPPC